MRKFCLLWLLFAVLVVAGCQGSTDSTSTKDQIPTDIPAGGRTGPPETKTSK